MSVKPTQVTLVPDPPQALTSNAGWNIPAHADFLGSIIATFHKEGIRTSIFIDANPKMITAAKLTGTDRVELYTESYARNYSSNPKTAIQDFVETAKEAELQGIGLNAGHDLSLTNLQYFKQNIPGLLEVSIGHALICDALYLGLEKTIQSYLQQLQ